MKVALDNYGGAHVLVANASVARPSAFEKLSEKDWDEVLAVHLRATYKVSGTIFSVVQVLTGECIVREGPLAHLPQAEVWSHRDHGVPSWSL